LKAAVLEELEKLVVRNVPTPTAADGEILVRVRACAVCGSDIRIFHKGNPRVKPPQIIGHEVAGVIEAVGDGVTGFAIGDRIALGADVPCGVCKWCRRGLGNNCLTNYAIGYQFPGGFAQYILLNETTVKFGPVHRIPAGLDFEAAALAEPLACVINGIELVQVHPGDTVVVFGAGPVGCMIAQTARRFGATTVVHIEYDADRLETAKGFGADHFILSSTEDPVERVMEITSGEGADVVLTACPAVATHKQAIEMAAHRGRVNLFGGLGAGAPDLAIQSNLIHYKECFVLGSHGSVPRQHRIALDFLAAGYINAGDYVSHRFGLDEIHRAFEAAEKKEGLKVVVQP